ncbi:MAG: hypothetical protein LBN29_12015 [Mediterranea sp.]|jgi:hypothetical protein|nr:hypothetical protein [Mediterranea sp.]
MQCIEITYRGDISYIPLEKGALLTITINWMPPYMFVQNHRYEDENSNYWHEMAPIELGGTVIMKRVESDVTTPPQKVEATYKMHTPPSELELFRSIEAYVKEQGWI